MIFKEALNEDFDSDLDFVSPNHEPNDDAHHVSNHTMTAKKKYFVFDRELKRILLKKKRAEIVFICMF